MFFRIVLLYWFSASLRYCFAFLPLPTYLLPFRVRTSKVLNADHALYRICIAVKTIRCTGKPQRQEMKLLMRRCEQQNYVKISHAVQHLKGANLLTFPMRVEVLFELLQSCRVRSHEFLRALMRDTDEPHFIEKDKIYFLETLEINARMHDACSGTWA